MKVQNWLSVSTQAEPDRTAIAAGGEKLTYLELDRRAGGAARRLADLGLRRGDRVATTLPAGLEFAELLHGGIRGGICLVPLDPGLPDLDDVLTSLGAPPLIDRRDWDEGPAEEVTIELDDPLCLIRTSGSSGGPRFVELSVANHLWSAVGCGMRIDMTGRDSWLCCLPVHHVGGLAIFVRTAIYGATAVAERFETDAVLAAIESERVTVTSLVATMLQRLVERGDPAESLRCALLGGGPAPASLIERASDAGWPLAPTYGMTETCSQVTTLRPDELIGHAGSAGKALPSTEIRIDEQGRILVRGKTVARELVSEDGWFHTSDLGRVDQHGYLYVQGRADEVLISGGENVSPEEVERVLLDHPAVSDAAVFGRDDPKWQNAVIAAVVLSAQLPEQDLRDHCGARLEPFKVPKAFEFVDELPRNAQGKLLRRRLS